MDIEKNELKFQFNNEKVNFEVCQSIKKPKKMNMVSLIDVIYKRDLVVPVKEQFVVETLATVQTNFDSSGIKEYDETLYALNGMGSYLYALRNQTWT